MNELLRQAGSFINRNAPTILTCIGGAGLVATAVTTATATPKALRAIEQAKEEKGEELTKFEKVKAAGPAYIPPLLIGVGTLACVFGANALNKRQQASLISAYALLENSYREYKGKVVEIYGEDADKHIREEIAKDVYVEEEVTKKDDSKVLFYDDFSGRYFESTPEQVVKAEYEINRKISLWGGAHVNEFYEFLDIPPIEGGDCLGWSSGLLMEEAWSSWLDFDHDKTVMDDGLECYIITMRSEPTVDYMYY